MAVAERRGARHALRPGERAGERAGSPAGIGRRGGRGCHAGRHRVAGAPLRGSRSDRRDLVRLARGEPDARLPQARSGRGAEAILGAGDVEPDGAPAVRRRLVARRMVRLRCGRAAGVQPDTGSRLRALPGGGPQGHHRRPEARDDPLRIRDAGSASRNADPGLAAHPDRDLARGRPHDPRRAVGPDVRHRCLGRSVPHYWGRRPALPGERQRHRLAARRRRARGPWRSGHPAGARGELRGRVAGRARCDAALPDGQRGRSRPYLPRPCAGRVRLRPGAPAVGRPGPERGIAGGVLHSGSTGSVSPIRSRPATCSRPRTRA